MFILVLFIIRWVIPYAHEPTRIINDPVETQSVESPVFGKLIVML